MNIITWNLGVEFLKRRKRITRKFASKAEPCEFPIVVEVDLDKERHILEPIDLECANPMSTGNFDSSDNSLLSFII
jgi:hypothetical protein